MYILGYRQQVSPIVLLEVAVDSQILFKPLIDALQLLISLGVIGGANVLYDFQ